ncbi:hypothetical protein [Nesterenkonia jeotgali]|uniref:Uncharacterized protein n=1 Tax=Nesterenkonia jeotgali TaxID=317018 RepID=A0A0W8ILK2_9MICC|nr:hypothetical protein [Nesterenkonia jeotgali]KUG60587.1 hypothetical protein AVL63_09535 [Nesterenkonia jeotgali]
MSTQPFDPWNSGTRAYRVTLVVGMACTAVGVILVILAAMLDSAEATTALRSIGLVLLGAGILSHLISIGLRRRQAVQILSRRASKDD